MCIRRVGNGKRAGGPKIIICNNMVPAAPKGAFSDPPLARGLLLATHKRVIVFFERHLVANLVFFQLVLYMLRDLFRIFARCIHIVSPTPEAPVPVFVLQVPMPLVDQQATLPF